MKDGPSIAPIAALAGDPARANMLAALLGGKALTAGELANEAGITAQTASSHLAKLEEGGLITGVKQGRHRYFKLSGHDVAEMLETMMGVAQRAGHTRTRTGPKAPELRKARVCYDHLAGEMGVALFDGLANARLIAGGDELRLTKRGEEFARDFGIDLDALSRAAPSAVQILPRLEPAPLTSCRRARRARCSIAFTISNGPAATATAAPCISPRKASGPSNAYCAFENALRDR